MDFTMRDVTENSRESKKSQHCRPRRDGSQIELQKVVKNKFQSDGAAVARYQILGPPLPQTRSL